MTGSLRVHLFGAAIGKLKRVGSTSVVFCANEDSLDLYGVGSTVFSTRLPFSAVPSPAEASTNFFGGLLPEGRRRTNLAKQAGVDSTDALGMLGYASWELPGAVNVGTNPGPGAQHIPASGSDIEQLLTRTADYAMGSVGRGGSLPGVQPKATLALLDGQWRITTGGAVSTHIVKPVASGEEWGAHWEAYCLEAVNHRATLTNIAGLLPAVRKLSLSQGDRHRLLSYTTFNAAIGNTDAHAKNFSILHFRDGKVGLLYRSTMSQRSRWPRMDNKTLDCASTASHTSRR